MSSTPTRALKVAATALATAAALVATAVPASAHSLGQAVVSGEGCGWSNGNYTILESSPVNSQESGRKLGQAYLLWNAQYGENCVVTMRTGSEHGVSAPMGAALNVRNGGNYTDNGTYAHYAAVSGPSRDKCVRYSATIAAGNGEAGQVYRPDWNYCD